MPFGLIYGTSDLATGCFETIIRDKFDITPTRILRSRDYSSRSAVNFSTLPANPLTLLDLTAGNAVRFGLPTDVIRYSDHEAGQYFSEFVYAELPDVDGLLYSSRFTELVCVAVYDRSIPKLVSSATAIGFNSSILAPLLAPWNVQVR